MFRNIRVPRLHSTDQKSSLILTLPVTQGEELLRTEDILSIIEDHGDSIALVMFSGKSTINLFTKMAKCDIF